MLKEEGFLLFKGGFERGNSLLRHSFLLLNEENSEIPLKTE